MKSALLKVFLTSYFLLLVAGCATTQTSLFDELGGTAKIELIVDNFIEEIAFDKTIYTYFAESNIERFREKLIEHLCFKTGGSCDYTGDTMQQVHAGMHINEADFNRTVELLIKAMNNAGIAHRTQNRILAIFAPMRKEIVYR